MVVIKKCLGDFLPITNTKFIFEYKIKDKHKAFSDWQE